MSFGRKQGAPGLSEAFDPVQSSAYRKVIARLMPFLLAAFMVNAIDRVNISFAKLRMAHDIALTDTAYGIGAGVFYLGYVLFEVPSNLYLQRVGARATLGRIMVLWGTFTVLTAFVKTVPQFIAVRFLLGMAEAGFFAGVILYLSYWFPSAVRGRITALFLMAGVVAGMGSGPFAAWAMTHGAGLVGVRDWQALFIIEGIPAIVLGVSAWFWLTDRPEDATWLSADEKRVVLAALGARPDTMSKRSNLKAVLCDRRVYLAGLVYFCVYGGSNTVSYWMPTLVRGFGIEDLRTIGMVSSLPYLCTLIVMYLLGRSSDRRQERRWHLAATMGAGASSFLALGFVHGDLILSILFLSVGAAAALSAIALFWTIPPTWLEPANAPGGIALISSIGTSAGIVSPIVVGVIKTATGSLYFAFDVMAATLVVGALLLLVVVPAERVARRETGRLSVEDA